MRRHNRWERFFSPHGRLPFHCSNTVFERLYLWRNYRTGFGNPVNTIAEFFNLATGFRKLALERRGGRERVSELRSHGVVHALFGLKISLGCASIKPEEGSQSKESSRTFHK